MVSIHIDLPEELRADAAKAAASRGVSLEEFVRECLAERLKGSDDPFLSDSARFEGETPADLSANHDEYLYGNES